MYHIYLASKYFNLAFPLSAVYKYIKKLEFQLEQGPR